MPLDDATLPVFFYRNYNGIVQLIARVYFLHIFFLLARDHKRP